MPATSDLRGNPMFSMSCCFRPEAVADYRATPPQGAFPPFRDAPIFPRLSYQIAFNLSETVRTEFVEVPAPCRASTGSARTVFIFLSADSYQSSCGVTLDVRSAKFPCENALFQRLSEVFDVFWHSLSKDGWHDAGSISRKVAMRKEGEKNEQPGLRFLR